MSEKIELSLSRKYVSSWGLNEAVREILQNAIDRQTEGYEVDVTYSDRTLIVSTFGAALDKSMLLLGESGKNDSSLVGKYGEGLKLAALVFARDGVPFSIYTGYEKWTPIFEKSDTFGTEVLKFIIENVDAKHIDSVVIRIGNIEQHEMLGFRKDFIALDRFLGRDIGAYRLCDYGTVLLNSEYSGRFYVNGLFVCDDSDFKYGYDFKAEYVNLDRDRRAMNYYDMCELTARSLTNCGDINILINGFNKSITDLYNAENVLDKELSKETAVNFKHRYFDSYDLPADTLVGTEKVVEVSGSEHVHVDNDIVGTIIAIADDRLEEYEELKESASSKDNYDGAVNAFLRSNYSRMFAWFMRYRLRLSKKAQEEFVELMNNGVNITHNFRLIKNDIEEILEMEA